MIYKIFSRTVDFTFSMVPFCLHTHVCMGTCVFTWVWLYVCKPKIDIRCFSWLLLLLSIKAGSLTAPGALLWLFSSLEGFSVPMSWGRDYRWATTPTVIYWVLRIWTSVLKLIQQWLCSLKFVVLIQSWLLCSGTYDLGITLRKSVPDLRPLKFSLGLWY